MAWSMLGGVRVMQSVLRGCTAGAMSRFRGRHFEIWVYPSASARRATPYLEVQFIPWRESARESVLGAIFSEH